MNGIESEWIDELISSFKVNIFYLKVNKIRMLDQQINQAHIREIRLIRKKKPTRMPTIYGNDQPTLYNKQ